MERLILFLSLALVNQINYIRGLHQVWILCSIRYIKRTRMKLLFGQFNDPISIWGARPVEKVSKTLNARMVQKKLFKWMGFSYGGLISTY